MMERILVVEDDEDVRDLIVETLNRWGYESVVAQNGKIGLETFRSQSFSLIITDIRMPVLDGLTMLKTIKKEDSKVSIIVITAYPSVDSAVESLVEGADHYLVKPINLDDLEAKIKKSFEKRKMQKALDSTKVANIVLMLLIPFWLIVGYFIARLIE
jgi:two-component system response regulator AtoC